MDNDSGTARVDVRPQCARVPIPRFCVVARRAEPTGAVEAPEGCSRSVSDGQSRGHIGVCNRGLSNAAIRKTRVALGRTENERAVSRMLWGCIGSATQVVSIADTRRPKQTFKMPSGNLSSNTSPLTAQWRP